jgi:hypothetical protein
MCGLDEWRRASGDFELRVNEPAQVEGAASFLLQRLQTVPIPARKLFAMIVREAYHGPLHPKPEGIATPPEILEACGLDVGEFYLLLKTLAEAGLVRISNAYPFEEIQLAPEASEAKAIAERCVRENVPLEDLFVNLPSLPANLR